MQKHQHTAHSQCAFTTSGRATAASTWLLLPLMTIAFLGCALGPQKDTSTPSGARSLTDIRAKGGEPKMRMALVALPDRIYEIPLMVSTRTAVAPSAVAAADDAVRATPAAAALSSRVNVAVVGIPMLAADLIAPAALPASAIAQASESPQPQPTIVAAVERTTVPLLVAPPESQAVVQPVALAQAVTPKLKFDTDYESVKHAVRFAFDQSVLGRQAQALMAKILPDAKIATQIKLTGFSDGIGTRAANERVAVARAQSIRDELVKHDVEPSKISVEPAVVAAVPKARQPAWIYAQFRRVDVDITKPKQALVVSINDPVTRPTK